MQNDLENQDTLITWTLTVQLVPMSLYYTGSTILVSLNIAHFYKLQFEIFTHFIGFADSKDITNNTVPLSQDFRILYTSSILAFSQWPIISLISSGWGSSHTCRQTLPLHRDHVMLVGNHLLEHIIRIDMTKPSMC